MKTHSLIAASILALSLSGYAVAQDTTTTTTQSGTTTTQPVKPSSGNSTANQTGTSTDQTQRQTGQTGTTTNDQTKTGQSTTTTTTDQNAASTSATQNTKTAMSSDIMVPADQLKGAEIWMANDFIGKTVYSENNENVGDINDVIFSKDGKIVGVVLGVGGFLGIGEKNVLVRLDALKMVNTNTANNNAGTGTGTTGTGTTTTTTGTSADNTTTTTGTAADNSNNYQLVITTTKEALEAAPSFDRKSRTYITNQ